MFRTAIVAHISRSEHAHELCDQVNAVYMTMDNGALGCTRNHLKAWTYLCERNPEPWSVVLEDDALPVADFTTQLAAALAAAPSPVVSLYLGTSYPPHLQDRIQQVTTQADREHACWIRLHHMHGVATAIQTSHLPDLTKYLSKTRLPIDDSIREWARHRGITPAFTWPSLVDHRDQPSIVNHPDGAPRTAPRHAWRTGGRDHWTQRSIG